MAKDIDNNFTYHAPKDGQPERYAKIRAKAKELAELIDAECPQSRERSIAMTELETSVFLGQCSNSEERIAVKEMQDLIRPRFKCVVTWLFVFRYII